MRLTANQSNLFFNFARLIKPIGHARENENGVKVDIRLT